MMFRIANCPDSNIPFLPRPGASWPLVAIILAALVFVYRSTAGEVVEPLPARQTRAKFLLNFAEFTEWPETVFANQKEPIIVGVLGRDPFGKDLDKLAGSELLQGRRARIKRFRKVEEIKACHILYLSESEETRLERILGALKDRPVLTVSEIKDSATHGVIIQMRTESDKIRLAINLESAKAARLILKSKLLRLGQIVEPAKK